MLSTPCSRVAPAFRTGSPAILTTVPTYRRVVRRQKDCCVRTRDQRGERALDCRMVIRLRQGDPQRHPVVVPSEGHLPARCHNREIGAAQFVLGPVAPNALMETVMSAGLSAARSPGPSPCSANTPGPADSTRMSAPRTSSRNAALPSSFADRALPTFCHGQSSSSRATSPGARPRRPTAERVGPGCLLGARQRFTSAPSCASRWPQSWPRSSVKIDHTYGRKGAPVER